VVVSEPEGARRQADALRQGFLVESLAQFTQQSRELAASPCHPVAVGVIFWRWGPCVLFIQGGCVSVVAEFHGPGEVVIQLEAIDAAALHHFKHQPDEAFTHLWMRWIQPRHLLAVHRHAAAAVRFGEHPLGVVLHHGCVGRFHQAVFKPRNDFHASLAGFFRQGADGIELNTGFDQGRFNRSKLAAVEGGAPTPNVGIDGIEPRSLQFIQGPRHLCPVVIQPARTVGEPDPERSLALNRGKTGCNRRTHPYG